MNKKRNAHEGQFQVQNNFTMKTLESQAMTLIGTASEKSPISRKTLARRIGTDDRTVRLVIEVLRHNGEFIVAHEKGGYYYAESEKKYRQWRDSIESRIKIMNDMLNDMLKEMNKRWRHDLDR